jgi:hypothetical protein
MSEKVKVAVFLDADVAKALKIQSARQGEGVSKLIHEVFSCAHCRKPITEEFIVGEPKPVTGNRYGIFFHSNNRECAVASGTKVVYLPICPKCLKPAYQQFDRRKLYEILELKTVRFYHIACDEHWDATQNEMNDLSHLLTIGIGGDVAAP